MAEIVNKNPTNEPHSKPIKTHSKFNPNYSLYQSPNFGLNTPVLALAGVGEDEISVRLNSDIDTFSLKAPTMTPIKRSLDYFYLPLRALMPNTAELIITNPLRGDDIDAKNVNCVLDPTKFSNLASYLQQQFNDWSQPLTPPTDAATFKAWLTKVFRWLQIGSRLFSSQSLCKQLGYSFDSNLVFTKLDSDNVPEFFTFDQIFSVFIQYLRDHLALGAGNKRALTINFTFPTPTGTDVPNFSINVRSRIFGVGVESYHYESIDDLVYALFTDDGLIKEVLSADFSLFQDSNNAWINPFVDANGKYYTCSNPRGLDKPLNLLRLLAYQKASAEFYTVDTVDDVYSARLWEDNQRAWAYLMSGNSRPSYFRQNGVHVEYDSCSGYYVGLDLYNFSQQYVISNTGVSTRAFSIWAYFVNLFSYTRSLRYQDYFVGSRVRPLAVGDVTVQVKSGSPNYVDVIDVTKKIQVQRFLNQVNRVGRKFSDYMKGVLGSAPLPDAHEPLFLAHVVDTIGASETTNTGSDQLTKPQSKTSNYRSNSSRYAFTIHVAEPGIIIGIQNFDIPRVYGTVTDRENYHVDRYDAFNPYMQFVGDQEVLKSELRPGATGNFGYQQRYAEYKQRVSVAAGGFLGYLPGYAKVMDWNYIANYGSLEINSDFIRSRMNDLDEFYLQRYVDCPANSFHFIIRNDAEITAKRPMAFAPSIL